ncbi:MAG: NAD(P)H:quinone oxidoreductase [Promethearchaeota archaeon]|nr:MAG: NAD(P)H:quinone oxidoreductase [Candidatus Lokiarchaeota archaeon]
MINEREPKILILFYSMYGHNFKMAQAIAQGIKKAGGKPIVKQVEELLPKEYWDEDVKKAKELMKEIPIADPRKDLRDIDGIIVGTPTRYGNMTAQMRNFWDQTGDDWIAGTLVGKPAAVFTSSGTQHGGQETTIISTLLTLLHHGTIFVGLPYKFQEQMRVDEITGGTPYGPTTIVGPQGKRMPSENELTLARHLGEHLTEIAKKLMI